MPMSHAAARPRPYALAGAFLLLVAAALLGLGLDGEAALVLLAALMLLVQAALLHRSASSGLPAEEERLRAALLLLEGERLLELRDAPRLPLPEADASVDAVLAVQALSQLEDDARRDEACRELVRVLRPGGRLALLEGRATHAVALSLEDRGMAGVERSGLRWSVWPPARAVTAHRPGD
jgi:SAM-dependent methyltransferase